MWNTFRKFNEETKWISFNIDRIKYVETSTSRLIIFIKKVPFWMSSQENAL